MGGDLSLVNVTKQWDTFSLKNVTLNIKDGDYFVLVGPTGAGKTLLLETIQGFHQIDQGQILFDGEDITMVPPDKRRIAYVPQTPNLSLHQSVKENVEYPLKRRGILEEMGWEVEGIMKMMNITQHQDRETVTLSGGEKRKVSLARALIQQPKLLLLDEPLSNLDVTSKQDLREEIRMIHNYLGVTVIHVTHDQHEALSLASHLGVIRKGILVKTGTVEEVLNDPTDEYMARFLGYENIFNAKVEERANKITKMNVKGVIMKASKAPEQGQTRVAIHGDDINLQLHTPTDIRNNIYPGKVQECSNMGQTIVVTVEIGIPLRVNMSRRLFMDQGIIRDEEVWVNFAHQAVKQIRV